MNVPPGMPLERIMATFQHRCRRELLRLSVKVLERRAMEHDAALRWLEGRKPDRETGIGEPS
jgi:hypothetical protein